MPATSQRIGFILTEFRRSVAEDDDVKARYGSLARQSDDPIPTYFGVEGDADLIAAERQALQSEDRRRFRTTLAGVDDLIDLDLSTVAPVVRFVDPDKSADMPTILCELAIDLGRNTATAILWG